MDVVRVACAGAVVRDAQGRILLVRRGTEPGRGLWSVPGGRTEPGETSAEAAVREVREETGLRIVVERPAGTVERPGPGGVVYVIDDVVAVPAPGVDPTDVRAGDDADEVRWVGAEDLARLDRAGALVDGLVEALSGWDLLPRPSGTS
ncbi:NUDIX domain-containing protein [Nocardioides sp. HDW12B]|uniref:NUDIX hydrolase n=1 Tax=Nocardioides sp. HDW12B TaxID=2714939 RepID=UPI0023F85D4F|nr:NUDIX domain-containing protein [Nocardioides sp. HDW12B]